MIITVLGSGTSTGVPVLGCDCGVCQSGDPRDKRTRSSILIENPETGKKILVDTGPDVRFQLMRENIKDLDSVLYTHFHYDHLGGLDDLRPISKRREQPLECFSNFQTLRDITKRYPYLKFYRKYQNLPRLDMKLFRVNPGKGKDAGIPYYRKFSLAGLSIQPVKMVHVPRADIFSTGFVLDKRFAYLTDFVSIYPADEKFLYNLELMIMGAPFWERDYPSHITITDAIGLMKKFLPRKVFITHLSHEFTHRQLEEKMPSPMSPAYDGLRLEI